MESFGEQPIGSTSASFALPGPRLPDRPAKPPRAEDSVPRGPFGRTRSPFLTVEAQNFGTDEIIRESQRAFGIEVRPVGPIERIELTAARIPKISRNIKDDHLAGTQIFKPAHEFIESRHSRRRRLGISRHGRRTRLRIADFDYRVGQPNHQGSPCRQKIDCLEKFCLHGLIDHRIAEMHPRTVFGEATVTNLPRRGWQCAGRGSTSP